jgi:predicted Rossmann-fold nucleotide-binding protein
VLPGGLGTYEEFFETLVGRQLREHAKPIGIVNDAGYFDPLVAMIEHGIEHRFIKPAVKELFTVDPDPSVVIDWLLDAPQVEIDPQRFLPMGRIPEPPDEPPDETPDEPGA